LGGGVVSRGMVSISIQTRILYVHERTFYAHEDADSNRHHVRALSIKKFARWWELGTGRCSS